MNRMLFKGLFFVCIASFIDNAQAENTSEALDQAPVLTSVLVPVPAVIPMKEKEPILTNWFITAGGGAQFPLLSHMNVYNGEFLPPYNVDTYTIRGPESSGLFFLSAGRRWERDTQWLTAYSLGLYYQYLSRTTIKGHIIQYSMPEFDNYTYQWGISSNIVLASAKVNLIDVNAVSPYITAGIGAAFNRSAHYTERAYAGITPRISPAFSSSTQSQFAYQVGAGFDIRVMQPLFLSVGYLYQNIGRFTGNGQGADWVGTALNLNAVAQNEVVASISYLFNG